MSIKQKEGSNIKTIKRGHKKGDFKVEHLKLTQDKKDSEPTQDNPQNNDLSPYNVDILEPIEKILRAPSDKKIKWSDFTVSYLIGSGGFGEVFLG